VLEEKPMQVSLHTLTNRRPVTLTRGSHITFSVRLFLTLTLNGAKEIFILTHFLKVLYLMGWVGVSKPAKKNGRYVERREE
jgi:hypothetical protein